MASSYAKYLIWNIQREGKTISLEIYRKITASTPAISQPMRIGKCVVALSIGFDGNQEIDSAIIKSVCNISLVDRTGMVNYVDDDGYTVKSGGWDIFYSPDSTMWKVVVLQDGQKRWSGYITPDSYSVDLDYYPVTNITARDNIGHLQDFACDATGDANGMISLGNFIDQAMAKIDLAMEVVQEDWGINAVYEEIPTEYPTADPGDLRPVIPFDKISIGMDYAMIVVESLKDKTWLDALEDVLSSFGLCVRYIDNNQILICTLRQLPRFDNYPVSQKAVVFVNRSGNLTKSPAFKEIYEDFRYDTSAGFEVDFEAGDYEARTVTVSGQSVSTWSLATSTGWRMSPTAGTLNPGNSIDLYRSDVFVMARPEAEINSSIVLKREIPVTNFITRGSASGLPTAELFFKFDTRFYVSRDGTVMSGRDNPTIATLCYGAGYVDKEGKRYMIQSIGDDGYPGYVSDYPWMLKKEVRGQEEAEVTIRQIVGKEVASVFIEFYGVIFSGADQVSPRPGDQYNYTSGYIQQGTGVYGCMRELSLTLGDDITYENSVTRTVYNESNNVSLQRSPAYGSGPQVITPRVILNGLYGNNANYHAIRYGYFPDLTTVDSALPLSALIHKEILTYHAYPYNILTGTILADDPKFRDLFIFDGRKHIMTSGMLNMLTGQVENVTLREFDYYEDIWED